jgi:hypothetical protein
MQAISELPYIAYEYLDEEVLVKIGTITGELCQNKVNDSLKQALMFWTNLACED